MSGTVEKLSDEDFAERVKQMVLDIDPNEINPEELDSFLGSLWVTFGLDVFFEDGSWRIHK